MNAVLTFLRYRGLDLIVQLAFLGIAFVLGGVFTVLEIDQTVGQYIQANGCPVDGEDR
ncbi:hypothetical protein [Marinobacter sp. SS21]|uniref:hypothetical protein n=1 Tax=Marinobacter sp. SS21 TaxID=2979460 RepID=UPI00232EE9E9|nr:hypothetical protein [Marinobacter sp. SS21]MDC0664361.1 hypothetical protein [Marinobacter sp. SS21]